MQISEVQPSLKTIHHKGGWPTLSFLNLDFPSKVGVPSFAATPGSPASDLGSLGWETGVPGERSWLAGAGERRVGQPAKAHGLLGQAAEGIFAVSSIPSACITASVVFSVGFPFSLNDR